MDGFSAIATQHTAALGRSAQTVRLARLVVTLGMILLTVAGGVLFARRFAGALTLPLSPAVLGSVAASLAGAALVFRRFVEPWINSPQRRVAVWGLPSLAIGLWILGLTLPGTDPVGVLLLCGLLLLEEGWTWGRVPTVGLRPAHRDVAASPRQASPAPEIADTRHDLNPPDARGVLADELASETSDALHDTSTTQQIVRRREVAGEVIEGWARVELAAGQRHAAAHLAICPPLERTPICYAEQADGPPAIVKVTQAMTYGVRCEVKLDEPAAEPTSVVVEFSIQEPAVGETAASDAWAND